MKAKELLEVFQEYLNEEKKLIFEEWKNTEDMNNWDYLKAKLRVLEELESFIKNEADMSANYRAELEELDEIAKKFEKKEE